MRHTIKILIKIVVFPFLYLFLGVSYLMPREKNIWLFGSASQIHFSDNVKYLFIYVVENCPELRPIWISDDKRTIHMLKNKGFEAYYKYSFRGVYYALRAQFYFFFTTAANINFWASGGAVKVNLWHGVPIKTIGFDIKNDPMYNTSFTSRFLYPHHYTQLDYVLSTSQKVSDLFASAFRVEVQQCLAVGYPRNEILSSSEENIINFIEKYEPAQTKVLIHKLKAYEKVFIYMPTWRDNGRDFIKHAGIDFEVLNNILQEKNYCLILKLHHLTSLSVDFDVSKNIILFDKKLDIYPVLPFTDCLITDYSSIYFDYHLMDKEVILFPFDKAVYIDKDREMYYSYDKVTENHLLANSFEELLSLIKSDAKGGSIKNNLLKEMILETKGIKSSKAIVEFFTNY